MLSFGTLNIVCLKISVENGYISNLGGVIGLHVKSIRLVHDSNSFAFITFTCSPIVREVMFFCS